MFKRISHFIITTKSDLVLVVFFILLTALYALLMVRDHVPPRGLVLLVLVWLVYAALAGRLSVPTPIDLPVLSLVGLGFLSLTISVDWALTLPKVLGLILGAAIFFGLVNFIRGPHNLKLILFGLLVLSLGIAVLGMVGTDWSVDKIFELPQVYQRLPQLVTDTPRSTDDGKINANIMGGGLTLLVPLLASLVWGRAGKNITDKLFNKAWLNVTTRLAFSALLLLALALVSGTLLLTQSRGALLGTAVGLLALAIWKDRRFLWVLPLLLVNLILFLQAYPAADLADFLLVIDARGGVTVPIRLEFWQRSLRLIQDFPFTGTGIGTFGVLVSFFYPFASGGEVYITQAHNMILAVAVDLGLPALVLYTALLSSFFFMIFRSIKKATPLVRALLMGVACGMLAHQVFGIMDAFMIGSKLGGIMWIYYGLAAAIYVQQDSIQGSSAFESAIYLNPGVIPVFLGAGSMYDKMGQIEKALAANQQALSIKPDHSRHCPLSSA